MSIEKLSDQELLWGLQSLVGDERSLMSQILAYLGEVDARELYLDQSCFSMFEFCVRKLRFSEDQACRRISVARLAREFPLVLVAIADGRLHLTSADRMRPFFNASNVDELIERASYKTKAELAVLVAKLAPKADVPESIAILPQQFRLTQRTNTADVGPDRVPAASEVATAEVKPLSETRYCITLTVSAAVRDTLEDVRSMMRHTNASGDLPVIFERALSLLHESLEKQQRRATKRPRRSKGASDPGYVSAATRREVHQRDGSQCAFVSVDGERCAARDFLQLDHVVPRALGGTGEPANMRLLCASHNRHTAKKVFGREHVEARIRARQATSRAKNARALRAVDKPVDGALLARPAAEANDEAPAHAAEPSKHKALATAPEAPAAETPEREALPADAGMPCEVSEPRPYQAGKGPSAGTPFRDPRSTREIVRSALIGDMCFRSKDTDHALAKLPATAWEQPLGEILRGALSLLTPPKHTSK